MRLGTAISIAALAMAAAGCGGSNTAATAPHTVTVTVTDRATPPPTGTLSTTTGSTPTSTTATAGTPACTAADLAPTFVGGQGATGNAVLTLALRNRSGVACHTYGFPGVQFIGDSGGLPTHSTRTTHDLVGSVPKARIVLGPGQVMSFRLVVPTDIGGGGPPLCVKASAIQVIAPDDTVPMRVAIPAGTYECREVTVTPLRLGTG